MQDGNQSGYIGLLGLHSDLSNIKIDVPLD